MNGAAGGVDCSDRRCRRGWGGSTVGNDDHLVVVDTKSGDFDPTAFVDHYEEAVVDLLKSKQAGRAVPKARAAEAPSNVVSLMDALKRSISSEKDAAKTQKTKSKKADDLRKQPQFKFPIEGGQAKQGKPAAKSVAQPKPSAAKSKRKSA